MSLSVRPARAEDAAAVAALARRFNAEDGNPPGPLTAEDLIALWSAEPPRILTLVAERDGALIGYALSYASFDTEFAARGFYLQDLYVVPGARRGGVGRALMAELARVCIADGGRYMFWNALVRNRGGRAFYRRLGAREEPVVTLSLQPDALERLAREGGNQDRP